MLDRTYCALQVAREVGQWFSLANRGSVIDLDRRLVGRHGILAEGVCIVEIGKRDVRRC